MGISGLLPLLKSVQKPVHLSELSGKTIAVDAYVWLHRGVCCCATELATGKPTTKYVEYAMQRVRLLQHYNIMPYLVFDGGPLPAKQATELRRKRKRKESLEMANSLTKRGKHNLAREHYLKAVDVTPQMAFQLIKALRAHEIPYVVAPYEADAQLFYLESIGLVDGILTEDSDLLVFGAKSVYFKLDTASSSCISIQSETLASNSNPDFPLRGWGLKELRECAMLNGCDYLEGIPGVGLKTASRYLRKWRTVEKTLRALRMEGKVFESEWGTKMRIAEVGFLHQRVWDPMKNEIVYLTEPDPETWNAEREHFVGKYIAFDLASGVAIGDIDPTTLKPIVDILPSYHPGSKENLHPLTPIDSNRLPTGNIARHNSILNYFQKQTSTTPKQTSAQSTPLHKSSVGKASGKRTLVEEYERETSAKRSKSAPSIIHNRHSKFFASSHTFRTQILVDEDNQENMDEFDLSNSNAEVSTVLDYNALDGIQGVDSNRLENNYLAYTSLTPTRSSKTEGNYILDLSSPFERIAVSSCSTPIRPKCPKATTDDISEERGHSPNSSDGRISSPPSTRKNSTRTEAQKTGGKFNEDSNGLIVDLNDTFFGEDTGSDGIGSPPLRFKEPEDVDELADHDIDDDLQRRQRLVAEGWEKKFSRYAHTPPQSLQRSPTVHPLKACESRNSNSRGSDVFTCPNQKSYTDEDRHKVSGGRIDWLQMYRFT